jgi:cell wall-associated NlpC family hydrolase
MLAKLLEGLQALAHSLVVQKPLLARARRRTKADHDRALQSERQRDHVRDVADRLRLEGHPAKARRKDKKAERFDARAQKMHRRAASWGGRVKVLVQRIKGIETDAAKIEAETREYKKEHGVSINTRGNEVTGGTARQRLRVAALHSAGRCARGQRANFYSQPGAFTTNACFTGESHGERSDCSQWIASVYEACGLEIPGTWTGDMVGNGEEIRRDQLKPGDAVIYGSGAGFHTELYVGPGDRTIGHGSAPIDSGVVDLMGDGDYRCFRYLND